MFMRAIAPAAIGSTILLASCSAGDDAANDDGGAFAAPVGYVLPVQRDVIEYDTFTGRFAALQDVEIRPRVSGFVETVEFEEGALVEAGQPLFRLDRERFAAEVTRLEAQRRESQTAADLAGTELARAEGLLERRAVSQEEVDRLRAEVLSAEAVVAGVDADIRRARIDLGECKICSNL